MSIGDIHSDERGTGARFNDGKTALGLIPLDSLSLAADVFEFGAKKYKKHNWMKGQPWSVPMECAMRHLAAIQRGEIDDPDSGLPHIGHLLCNAIMLAHYYKHYPEGNDLQEMGKYFTLQE